MLDKDKYDSSDHIPIFGIFTCKWKLNKNIFYLMEFKIQLEIFEFIQ
jgi:hypothetical protein